MEEFIMKTLKVKFDTIEQIKEFVNEIQALDADVDLVHNRYVVDAKSIMGIFSMDLSRPLDLVIHSDDAKTIDFVEKSARELSVLA